MPLSACQPRRDIPAVNVKNPPRRNRTMMFVVELRRAALNLHTEVARWVRRTLDGGWFRIEPGAYEHGDPGGAVCPIVAAATMAGRPRPGVIPLDQAQAAV